MSSSREISVFQSFSLLGRNAKNSEQKNRGEVQREKAKDRLCEKGRSGIQRSGIPSDWSILTDFVDTRALLKQMRIAIWYPGCQRSFSR